MKKTVRIRTCAAVLGLELAAILGVSWLAGGMPGIGRETQPPSVTIQFVPTTPAPAPVRAYRI